MMIDIINLVSGGDLSEVRDVGNGTHRESLVHKSIMDEHVGHSKHRYSQSLLIK